MVIRNHMVTKDRVTQCGIRQIAAIEGATNVRAYMSDAKDKPGFKMGRRGRRSPGWPC